MRPCRATASGAVSHSSGGRGAHSAPAPRTRPLLRVASISGPASTHAKPAPPPKHGAPQSWIRDPPHGAGVAMGSLARAIGPKPAAPYAPRHRPHAQRASAGASGRAAVASAGRMRPLMRAPSRRWPGGALGSPEGPSPRPRRGDGAPPSPRPTGQNQASPQGMPTGGAFTNCARTRFVAQFPHHLNICLREMGRDERGKARQDGAPFAESDGSGWLGPTATTKTAGVGPPSGDAFPMK